MKKTAVITLSMNILVQAMKRHASAGDYVYDGRNPNTPYFQHARQFHQETGTLLLFTRDVGHHTGGWFKNPDYEQCYHLSLSFWGPQTLKPRSFDHPLAAAWVQAFYGAYTHLVWEEGPQFNLEPEVRHYRVFCDAHWQPILPRGEVYSKEFTEKGWKSFSELNEGLIIEGPPGVE